MRESRRRAPSPSALTAGGLVADVVLLGTVILVLFIVGFTVGVLIVVGVLGRRRGSGGGDPGAGAD